MSIAFETLSKAIQEVIDSIKQEKGRMNKMTFKDALEMEGTTAIINQEKGLRISLSNNVSHYYFDDFEALITKAEEIYNVFAAKPQYYYLNDNCIALVWKYDNHESYDYSIIIMPKDIKVDIVVNDDNETMETDVLQTLSSFISMSAIKKQLREAYMI